ncbi:MAG TPA: DUF481 domain-containing protein [Thermoanaerobaculia bacterium]|jgi:putative salt-induced outer membrane protein YdiY
MKTAPLMTITLGILLAAASAAQDESAAEDEGKGWADSAELSLVATSGNTETTTFALKNTLSREWESARFKLDASALRAESDVGGRFAVGTPGDFDVVDPDAGEITAESYALQGRFERDISERLFWFAGGGWKRNELAGLENRYHVEAGAGNVWYESDAGHLRTGYALTATRQDDVVPGPDDSETFLGVQLSLDCLRQLTSSTSYAGVVVVDENLDDTGDLRVQLDQSLSVAINDRLALKASLELSYDNQPALEALPLFTPEGMPTGAAVLAELDELDSVFKTALVMNF